ncbi:hypothetical protein Mal4_16590 [Maioricimonas rarisocia]|uniref:Uncharacterized protein n=1 Tax=Maioricimonas rarisocia TaxID=2528026 RepID=A0A517Z4D7_9PLAN|nr:hypothetical protein [Maioricimonas rarisocia]QDU37348.1 hypothetical protein Mal4_16590 [Maioricimonas rarisocia]
MREHLDPEVAKRCRTITYISAVVFPLIIFAGFEAAAPVSAIHWVGRGILVLFTLYAEPAIYLTMALIYRLPFVVSLAIALAPVVLVGWSWIVRWLF